MQFNSHDYGLVGTEVPANAYINANMILTETKTMGRKQKQKGKFCDASMFITKKPHLLMRLKLNRDE